MRLALSRFFVSCHSCSDRIASVRPIYDSCLHSDIFLMHIIMVFNTPFLF